MTNWKNIHPDFTPELQKEWEEKGFSYKECKEWIDFGMKAEDATFCVWLRDFKKKDSGWIWWVLNYGNAERLREEYNKTSQEWLDREYPKGKGGEVFGMYFNVSSLGSELDSAKVVKSYDDLIGLTKEEKTRTEVIYIRENAPEGELDLSDFSNLKKLDFSSNKLTSLNVSNCSQLERIDCFYNQLTNITLPTKTTNLKILWIGCNNFTSDLSFLVPYSNLESLNLWNNKFTGSLDYLREMKQLRMLDIRDTDINEVNIDKLPRSLKEIYYSADERPDCKLTEIVPLLEKYFGKHGCCKKCGLANTSEDWCQPCAEKEWEQLSGQELINKFIEQQKKINKYNKLKWIPYKEFTDIEYLAEGGFSKIYKAKWNYFQDVVLKSLNNSQNVTFEFLTEIANTKLVNFRVVECHGISQDPQTKNYVMVMEYMKYGNLRQVLQRKGQSWGWELSLKDKLEKLKNITHGLDVIHLQNLVHRDFHSGNILNSYSGFYITDLGLSRPVNHQPKEGQIFGVLPYVAPEVLRGKPYTQASDVYSFGIIAYEWLVQAYPYPKMNDLDLSLKVCNGYRPDIDKVPLPSLLKDLIKRCWDSNPDQRPKVKELDDIINSWVDYSGVKKNTSFYQQYQEIEAEYNTFSENTPYQIHSNAILHSKPINTKQITELLSHNLDLDLNNFNLDELNIQGEENDWKDVGSNFSEELVQNWQNQGFSYQQTQDWINIGLNITDYNFVAWLRDTKKLTAEEVLNHHRTEDLRQEYQQLQSQIEQSPSCLESKIEQPPK